MANKAVLLIIMRHGEVQALAPADTEPPLTDRGRQQVINTAQQIKRHLTDAATNDNNQQQQVADSTPNVLTSPYRRAQQTGQLVADVLHCTIDTMAGLTPYGNALWLIQQLPKTGTVLLVSHMPLVQVLTGLLSNGAAAPGPAFAVGMAVALTMTEPGLGKAQQQVQFTPCC